MAEKTTRYFKSKEWIEKTKLSYTTTPSREFSEISVGQNSIPVVMENINIGQNSSVRALRFAGIFTSDYLDFEGRESITPDDITQILTAAQSTKSDLIWLSNIPHHSNFYVALRNYQEEKRGDVRLLDCVPTFGIVCEETYDDYLKSISKNTRRNIKRKNRKLDDLGASFSIAPADRDLISQFLEIQDMRAREKALSSIQDDKQMKLFISSLKNEVSVFFSTLSISGKPISQLLLLVHDKSIAIFMQGFDPKWARYSPSFCNISRLIKYAHEQGFAYIDFLRGEEEYKLRFCNTKVELSKFVAILNPKIDINKVVSFVENFEE